MTGTSSSVQRVHPRAERRFFENEGDSKVFGRRLRSHLRALRRVIAIFPHDSFPGTVFGTENGRSFWSLLLLLSVPCLFRVMSVCEAVRSLCWSPFGRLAHSSTFLLVF